MSKPVFNTWLRLRMREKNPQSKTGASSHCPANKQGSLSLGTHLLCMGQRLPRNEPGVSTSNSAGLDQPSMGCISTSASSHGNYLKRSIIPTARAQNRGSHICAVEVACALKPMGLCLFQLLLGIQCNPSQESLTTAWELAGSQLPVALLVADHWGIYYKLHKYFSHQIWSCHYWRKYALIYTSGKRNTITRQALV